MKKVMFIMTKLGGTGWGGAHKVSVMLANYLAEHGYDVYFSVSEIERMDYPINESIKIFCLTDFYKDARIRQMNLIKKLLAFRKLCKDEGIDVIVGFTSNMAIYSVLAAICSRRKAVISERTDPHIEPRSRVLRGLRNILFCFANKVIFQTPGARDYYPAVVRKKGTIIPNPISDTLPEQYHGEREKKVVNFCRIAPQKNLKVLLEAFDIFAQEHSDYILEIYGDAKKDDAYKKEIEDYAGTLSSQSRIRFYPACQDVHKKVRKAAMFASSSDYEGISNSMLEAMAIGLPVIVTDCKNGGERMCIDSEENGMIVPMRDAKALALAMQQIAEDDEFSKKLSINSVKVRERFAISKIFDAWEEIIKQL